MQRAQTHVTLGFGTDRAKTKCSARHPSLRDLQIKPMAIAAPTGLFHRGLHLLDGQSRKCPPHFSFLVSTHILDADISEQTQTLQDNVFAISVRTATDFWMTANASGRPLVRCLFRHFCVSSGSYLITLGTPTSGPALDSYVGIPLGISAYLNEPEDMSFPTGLRVLPFLLACRNISISNRGMKSGRSIPFPISFPYLSWGSPI